MEIKISNENYDRIKFNIWFTQPKYYFGQLLKSHKSQFGIVVGIGRDTNWYYLLLNFKTNGLLERHNENELIPVDFEKSINIRDEVIYISNQQLETHKYFLRFTQPKYHFGQLLKFPDEEGLVGVVTEMQFKQDRWYYDLVEASKDFPPLMAIYTEQELSNLPQLLTQA